MTQDDNNLLNLLTQSQEGDFLKAVLKTALESLMNKDISNQVNASLREQTSERETYRNGYRERSLNTGVGSLDLKIPKVRKGTYFPPFLNFHHLFLYPFLKLIILFLSNFLGSYFFM